MVLRNPIPNTKQFFQKALHNFNSFFCTGYHKLPKTPPPPPHNRRFSFSAAAATLVDVDNNIHKSYEELEKFYNDFTHNWDSEKDKKPSKSSNKSNKKVVLLSTQAEQEKEVQIESPSHQKKKKKNKTEQKEECDNRNNKRGSTHQRGGHQDSSFNPTREHRNYCVVEKKLRELEMLEMSDVDHVLDIEEVLHYYSRLTCPLYLQIVDKFFMEIYTEFFDPARPASPRSVNSRLRS